MSRLTKEQQAACSAVENEKDTPKAELPKELRRLEPGERALLNADIYADMFGVNVVKLKIAICQYCGYATKHMIRKNPPKDKWHVQRIAKKQAGTRIYYHVTFANKLPKILMDGIVPSKKRVWGSRFGEKLGVLGRVYCWRSYETAYKWAFKQAYDFKRHTIIIAFREHYSKIHEEGILFSDGKQYYKVGSVHVEQVVDVYDPVDERVWKR